jgi:hypothetical protein
LFLVFQAAGPIRAVSWDWLFGPSLAEAKGDVQAALSQQFDNVVDLSPMAFGITLPKGGGHFLGREKLRRATK